MPHPAQHCLQIGLGDKQSVHSAEVAAEAYEDACCTADEWRVGRATWAQGRQRATACVGAVTGSSAAISLDKGEAILHTPTKAC